MNVSECMTGSFRWTYKRRLLRALHRMDQLSRDTKEELTTVERMRRIKLAADLYLALTCHGTAWSRAVITNYISQGKKNKRLVKEIVGKKRFNDMIRIKRSNAYSYRLLCSDGMAGRMKQYLMSPRILSRNIIRRSIHRKNAANISSVKPCDYIVRLKTVMNESNIKQLKRVIPGGETMNSPACLLREAADYIVSLRTQVQVMHSLAYHSAAQPQL